MVNGADVFKEVGAALEREPLINIHHYPIAMEFSDGALTLTGEVASVAAKKLAMEVAAAVPGVTGIVDRLRVEPAEQMEDGVICNHVRDALLQEHAFMNCSIRTRVLGKWETVREAPLDPAGIFEVEVGGGVVTLNGQVGSLSHKRLAGVLAWWVPGSRDVVNGLEVVPPEEDNDDEVIDALRLVLEKDPFVNAAQIRVSCRNFTVTLDGLVANEQEREAAGDDAWYLFRVDRVVNRLEVAA